MKKFPPEVAKIGLAAWYASESGNVVEALHHYQKLDCLMPKGARLDPELSVLRHNAGVPPAGHFVRPIPATEDCVVGFQMSDTTVPGPADPLAMEPEIDHETLIAGIKAVYDGYDIGVHGHNATGTKRHIMVLSTGRCGTMSMYRLFDQHPTLLAYHSYWWMLPLSARIEMMCRIFSGVPDQRIPDLWASMRAAEWLCAEANGMSMVGVNHLDTVFAPIFARIHPHARFLHLRRDPIKVFDSFMSKHQWMGQLAPVTWAFADGFQWNPVAVTVPRYLAWYLRFTEVFAEAVRVLFPARSLMVSSDRLFAGDVAEINDLSHFVGVRIDPSHFDTKVNAKDHKICINPLDLERERREFVQAYRHFGGSI